MVQPQTADAPEDGPDEGMSTLKTELQKTREAIETLTREVVALNRRTILNWIVTGVVLVLLVVVAAGATYGYFYIQDSRDKDRQELAEDRASLEQTLRNGCENSVNQQQNGREELLEFGRYLGERNDVPSPEIEAALNELISRFSEINPPRDCAAEADARQAQRAD